MTEHPTRVAVVAPVLLQNAFSVLLQAVPNMNLVVCSTVQEQPPDLVLLDANKHDRQACNQVRQIKTSWPTTRLLVLIEYTRQQALVRAAGADVVLLKGASPKRLLNVIYQLRQEPQEPT